MQLATPALALAALLTLTGLAGLAVGIYALVRGGRGQRGGLGPFSERFIHAAAGVRMVLGGAVALVLGILIFLSSYAG